MNLSLREQQIIDLLKKGLRHSEIAEQLHISRHTVYAYCDRVAMKIGRESRKDVEKYV